MMYPNLFKSKYALFGRDWIKALEPDDLRVFIEIGLSACEHGHLGGLAIVEKRGRDYMSRIGRIGAIASNSKRLWNRLMIEEMERIGIL